MRVNVPVVTLDISVLTHDGLFAPGLTQQNFRVLEDGVPQPITSFNLTEEPVRAVLMIEFSAGSSALQYNALLSSHIFVDSLRPEDWEALVLYDKTPHIQQDFTQDKMGFYAAVRSIGIPLSREINLYDALYDTLDRMEPMRGHKYIILMGSGQDTFSRKIYDQVLKKLEFARNTVIYPIESGHGVNPLSAENAMRSFARISGGKLYFAASQQDYADAFSDLTRTLRNRYTLSYHSTHTAQDGSWHKIKVELVNPDGSKKPGYQITVREGYRVKTEISKPRL